MESILCRLCELPAVYRFRKRILADTRECRYYECSGCGSLQSEKPSWLHHSYAEPFHMLGVESVYRSIWSQALVHYCCQVLCVRGKLLDWGGGHGLLCRLLRDLGYDAWVHDQHTTNLYVPGFQIDSLLGFSMITAFEVFEHLANPAAEAGALLGATPDFVIVGTERYQGQGDDWYYLFPFSGQHVFFWSQKAHEWLARRYGYEVISCGRKISVYAKQATTTRIQRLLISICEYGAKATQPIIPFLRRPGVARDQAEIIERVMRQAGDTVYD